MIGSRRNGNNRLKSGVCMPMSLFEFVIRSVNNVKTARQKTVNQSENEYGRDNYTDC